MNAGAWWPWLKKALQYAVGLSILVWLIVQPDWSRVISVTVDIPIPIIGAVLVATLIGLAFRFLTWHLLIDEIHPVAFLESVKTVVVIGFINQLLPSRITGRSIAPVVIQHYSDVNWGEAVAVATVHTALYAVLYGLVSLIGLGLIFDNLSKGILLLVAISTIAYLAIGIGLIVSGFHLDTIRATVESLPYYSKIRLRLEHWLPNIGEAISSTLKRSAIAIPKLLNNPSIWVKYGVFWGCALVLFPSIRVWLLFDGLGYQFEPILILPIYLIVSYSVTLLPITPGGLGVTEATAAFVFIGLGVPESIIVPTILMDRILGVYLPAVLGGIPALRIDFSELR